MFKILAYGYMEYRYSSRKIETSCRRDINFMWLLSGEPVPDHSTINRFRKERLGVAMEGLFYQLVGKLCELGEVSYSDVFVDGTKLEANANRYTFVWKKAVEKHEAKMLMKVEELSEEIVKVYHTEFSVSKETVKESMEKMASFLEGKKAEENIEFVHGKGKRKSNLMANNSNRSALSAENPQPAMFLKLPFTNVKAAKAARTGTDARKPKATGAWRFPKNSSPTASSPSKT